MLLSKSNRRSLFRFDAIITLASGVLMMAVPSLLINLLQLGSMPEVGVRLVGAEWALYGLWLFYIWNADYTKPMAIFNAVVLALNADLLILVALFGGYGLGLLGWASMLGTTALIAFIALQWWLLSRKMTSENAQMTSMLSA